MQRLLLLAILLILFASVRSDAGTGQLCSQVSCTSSNDVGTRVYNSTAITIPLAAVTALTFNTERYDTNNMHSTVSNTGRITFNQDGKYTCSAHISWDESTANDPNTVYTYISIRLGGSTTLARSTFEADARVAAGYDVLDFEQSVSTTYSFVITEYVEVVVFQLNSEANPMDISSSGNYSPEFVCQRIS